MASLLTLALLHIKVDDTAIGIARAVRIVIHCQTKQARQISLTVSTATQGVTTIIPVPGLAVEEVDMVLEVT